ncbi:MAG: ATP-binding protein [Permianibacter sp.]
MPLNEARSFQRLRTAFHLGALLFFVAIALAMQYLLGRYADARAQTYLTSFQVNAELKAKQMDLRFRLLADHVHRLRMMAEQHFQAADLPPGPELQAEYRNDEVIGYGLPAPSSTDARGNIYAHQVLDTPALRRERDVAWALFLPMLTQHRLDDALRWSGIVSFHSGNWAAYPYQSVPAFLRGANETHIRHALYDQYNSPYFHALRQALHQHPLVWRAPSLDQAGTGYIISIFAPVLQNGNLQAYVLADVQLSFIMALLRSDLPSGMHVQIVTDSGDLIADSDGSQPSSQRSMAFYPAAPAQQTNTASENGWQADAAHYQLKRPLTSVVWQMRTLIERSRISELVNDDIRPLREARVFFLAMIALVWWLLSRYFVTPALQLAELATLEDIAREPRLPRFWQAAKTQLRKLIVERRVALRTLESEREKLEQQVRERTRELQNQNTELEAFNFAVSHDLRAPLRAVDGFISALNEDYGAQLDATGQRFIARAKAGVSRMEELIEALLTLSQLSRVALQRERINLSELAESIVQELRAANPDRQLTVTIEAQMWVEADRRLLRAALENLLSNAVKYTSKTTDAQIRVYTEQLADERVYVVADNGAGFDMHFAERLFTPFQRMHRQDEFTGTGVGLSTVQRIIHRHGGRIWAEAAVGQGARFRFTLP